MQLDRFTIKSQEALQARDRLAADRRNTEAAPEHLLAALLEQHEGVVAPVLRKLGAQPDAIRRDVDAALDALPDDHRRRPRARDRAASCSTSCAPPSARRASCSDEYISTEHLLLALADAAGRRPATPCARNGATTTPRARRSRSVRGPHRVTDQNPEDKYQALAEVRPRPHARPPRTASSTR